MIKHCIMFTNIFVSCFATCTSQVTIIFMVIYMYDIQSETNTTSISS